MTFEDVINFARSGDTFRGTVPPHWRQGRTAYGGVLAAAAVRAMAREVESDRDLRVFTAAYVGPASADELTMQTVTLNEGKSVSTRQATIFSDGAPAMQLTAVFAKSRFSSFDLGPEGRRPESVEGLALEGMPFVPQFTANIDYRWLGGGLPFTNQDTAGLYGVCRHKTAAGSPVEAVIGLIDAWPAPVLPLLDGPAPASTVTWTAHLYDAARVEHPADAWWTHVADPVVFRDGYATTVAKLYAPDGRLAAWSEQLVAVYEKAVD